MIKNIGTLFIAVFLFVSPCFADAINRLITEKATVGALENLAIMDVEIQTRKAINGGMLIQGIVPCPYDIKKEQVKPTLLLAMKELKKAYPKCEWIVVFAQVAKGWYSGRAEYAGGKITIHYNIMDDKGFEEFNKEWVKAGNPPVKKPSKEEFLRAIAVDNTWQKVHSDLLDSRTNKGALPDLEEKIAATTASKLQMSIKDVVNSRKLLQYYIMSSDTETINSAQ